MKYTGLSLEKVKELQIQYGKNALPEEKEITAIKIFLSQFSNPLIFLLLFAGLISIFSKKYFEIVFIFSVLLLSVGAIIIIIIELTKTKLSRKRS
ncbi:hypothetical protein L6250_01865 [Candidatus Parcubacteria bacterium]|nr:hypothetical protein [Patescibacteria group bacterium]MBU4466613.1 hypothetical protein [Patescibacteria group bacterium]MCG2688361.1 hypothetical protein [Candidatus Parcubacteria bacterium]